MMNKFHKRFQSWLIIPLASIIAISLMGLMGCQSKELTKEDNGSKETVVEKNSVDNKELVNTEVASSEQSQNDNKDNKEIKISATSKTSEDKKQSNSDKINIQNNKSTDKSKINDKKMNFNDYINLLGISKEKLLSTLNEKADPVDEGGLEFKKAAIRVWFDKKSYTQVEQVLIMGKDINLNGVKIGDNINKFKEVFGIPISDRNGDAHFKYNHIFLSINYDKNTKETYAVYILKNDF